jgi:peptidyl-prolyl cis-trans isomerase D
MFESVTKRRKNPLINIFGWTLLTLVCIVFVFVGFSPDSSFLGRGGAAAEVNGDAISLRDYKELLDRLESNQSGDREARRQNQETAVNILVSRSLIVQEAERLNIHVSDQEVAQELLNIEPFFEDGQFSRLRYKTYLRQARLTESEFEDRIRRDLIIQKMSQIVGFAGKDLAMLDEFDKKIEQAQINMAYIQLSPEALQKSSSRSQDIKNYLEANLARVQEHYDKNKAKFSRPEEVKSRHILIKADDDSEEAMEAALEKAKQVAQGLNSKNFAQRAKLHSDDPGSKDKGGDLGFFSRGKMVPEFEEAAFAATIGQVSEPVRSQFGYHLILVDEKRPALDKSFEQVKTDIAAEFMAKESFDQVAAEFKSALSSGDGQKVESLVERSGLKWNTTGFFSITRDNVPGIGQSSEFFDLALSLDSQNEYPNRLIYQGPSAFVLKYKGAKMSEPTQQNDQMDFFKQLMRQQKMNSLVQTWADSLREQAKIKINPELLR